MQRYKASREMKTMNPDWLFKHFEQISEAPDAVPRLRRFILDLAVRGKLVEQDPADEPASELLKRIEAEKKRLIQTGRIRNQKPLARVDDGYAPFELPQGWEWCRLGAIINLISGQHLQPNEYSNDWQRGIPYITGPADFGESGLVITRYAIIRKAVAQEGQILLTVKGAGVGKCALCNLSEVAISRQLMAMDTIEWNQRFLLLIAHSLATDLKQKSRSLIPGISREDVDRFAFGLPPLAEQHRIVAKVDELMALCDELEAAQAKRESRRNRLVAATLHGLNNGDAGLEPGTRSTFEENARFYFNHLPRLTTGPEHIHQLRQTILNLAVRGKLVPQDPNDEPATDLIRKITVERLRLIQDKQIAAQKMVKPSEHFANGSKIPDTWQQCYLQDIAYQITDGTHLTPKYTDYGKPFLSAQNVKPFRFMPGNHRYVSERDFENYRSNRKPERGDILLTRVGAGIGEAAVLDVDMEFAFYVSLCLIKIPTHLLLPEFLVIWLNSPTGRRNSTTRTYGKGFSQGNLNLGLIRTFRVPLPPLAEQHRIVAKVHELMALCDEVEARLTTMATTRRQLLEATLHEALTGHQELHQMAAL